MNAKPLYDNVVVRPSDEKEDVSKGGIIIPDAAQEKITRGEVVACGDGKMTETGIQLPLSVKAGDKVLYGKYSGSEITLSGEKLLLMRESEIQLILL